MEPAHIDVHFGACEKCENTEFEITESYYHLGNVENDGSWVLHCKPSDDGGVEEIKCSQCGAEAPEGLEVEFN